MEWRVDVALEFIEEIRLRPLLWDRTDPSFRLHKNSREACWEEIGKIFNLEAQEAYRKWMSLKTSHHREVDRSTKEDEPSSRWFAMEAMSFMIPLYKKRTPKGLVKKEDLILRSAHPHLDDFEDDSVVVMNGDDMDYISVESPDHQLIPHHEEQQQHLHHNPNPLPPKQPNPIDLFPLMHDDEPDPIDRLEILRPDCVAFGKYVGAELTTLDYQACQRLKLRITQLIYSQTKHRKSRPKNNVQVAEEMESHATKNDLKAEPN